MNKEAWGWIIGGAISGGIITLINAIYARKRRKQEEEIKAETEEFVNKLMSEVRKDLLKLYDF